MAFDTRRIADLDAVMAHSALGPFVTRLGRPVTPTRSRDLGVGVVGYGPFGGMGYLHGLAATETEEMKRALGVGTGSSRQPSGAAAQLKELESEQKKRSTRAKRDGIDRALVDLAGFYRDVLAVQSGAEVELVNEEMREAVTSVARGSTPETTLRRIDAVLRARRR